MLSRRKFFYLVGGLGLYSVTKGCTKSAAIATFSDLSNLGSKYTFALIADPQLSEVNTTAIAALTTQKKLSAMIEEINNNSAVSFVIFDGDLVQRGIPDHISNFISRAEKLKPLPILVHGNHDGSYPYPELEEMQRTLNGTDKAQFSFDAGNWHYVTFPCNLGRNRERELELLANLDADLSAHRDRPVMVFEHLHLLPQGLTPLLWYTYDRDFRNEILDALTRYGNVRYVINGHVHNGIKASVKTSWTYEGIHFINAPTCLLSRNFGEEYPEFQAGLDGTETDTGGGYYLLVTVNGDEVQIRGRLVGVDDEFIYPASFMAYRNQEPLWFAPITAHTAHETIQNASFDNGFEGWMQSYRYIADVNPAYVSKTVSVKDRAGKVAHLFVQEKGRAYADEEIEDIYQWIKVPPEARSLVFSAYYRIDPGMLVNGGGYISLVTYRNNQPQRLVLFDWSQLPRDSNNHLGKYLAYVGTASRGKANVLAEMGQEKKAMFWEIPSSDDWWHSIQIDINQAYRQALGSDAAKVDEMVDHVLIMAGVWCSSKAKSKSGAFFDDFSIGFEPAPNAVQIDNQPLVVTEQAFQTDLGTQRAMRKTEAEVGG